MDEMAQGTYESEKKRVMNQDKSKDDIIDGIMRSAMENVERKAQKEKTESLINSIPKRK